MTTAVAAPPAVAAELVLVRMALPAKNPPAASAVHTASFSEYRRLSSDT